MPGYNDVRSYKRSIPKLMYSVLLVTVSDIVRYLEVVMHNFPLMLKRCHTPGDP